MLGVVCRGGARASASASATTYGATTTTHGACVRSLFHTSSCTLRASPAGAGSQAAKINGNQRVQRKIESIDATRRRALDKKTSKLDVRSRFQSTDKLIQKAYMELEQERRAKGERESFIKYTVPDAIAEANRAWRDERTRRHEAWLDRLAPAARQKAQRSARGVAAGTTGGGGGGGGGDAAAAAATATHDERASSASSSAGDDFDAAADDAALERRFGQV